ncbi:tripartite tricarboxylate transporter TctB family protein [Caenimonas terrae]|uniref:Tripartite tricarboxylate transporter TctB family protein n=1 Tax=Caenimonas terrae TaxID=696074 RepID=A0ABW0NB70_9BURK
MTQQHKPSTAQTAIGAGVVLIALALAAGAVSIPSAAGYGGIGPNFLPWAIAAVLALCGVMLVVQARTTGFRELDQPTGAEHGYWAGFAWVTAGLLANAALITTIGFIFSCTLCYLLAVQGLRRAAGEDAGHPRVLAIDLATGLAISAPVFWTFTQFLAINLPGLTSNGWI